MILHDNIAHHPKFLMAGRLIGGPAGASRALALWIAAIGYAREGLTDGLVHDAFLDKFPTDSEPKRVAKALSSPKVRLFHRVRHGYKIHDFHDYNGTADKLRQQRELARDRKRKQRAKEAVENLLKTGTTPKKGDRVTRDSHAFRGVTRARAIREGDGEGVRTGASTVRSVSSAVDVPRVQRRGRRATEPVDLSAQQTHDLARQPAADENFAVLVKLTHTVMDSEGNTDATSPGLIEAVKCAAATRGIRYPHQVLARALRSADAQRRLTTGPLSPMVNIMRTALTTKTLAQTARTFARGRR